MRTPETTRPCGRIPDAHWTRRQFVRGLGFGMLGLSLPEVLRLQARTPSNQRQRKAKSCILIFLFGGPSHIDIWDMKPNIPAEYRGEFKPITTSAPGILLCEHLPRTARVAHHLALVRSVTMSGRVNGDGDHHSDAYYMLTGHRPDRSFAEDGLRRPQATDWPFIGSTVASRCSHDPAMPGVVQLPARLGEDLGLIVPGQFSGLLGHRYEPLLVRGSLDKPRDLAVPQLALPADVDGNRLGQRRELLARLDTWRSQLERPDGPLDAYDSHHRQALGLLTSQKAQRAFDLSREPLSLRDRYGNDVNGQSVLLARRLVEAGVPFVCVHWLGRTDGSTIGWDTHSDNFGQLKNVLLPAFDLCLSALLEDLQGRGLLDETLVVVSAEMGRKPQIGDPRRGGANGRNHWIHCQTALFAGGGIRGGQVYGSSDRIGAYPLDRPVRPEDIAATIYQSLGIMSNLVVEDRQGRQLSLLQDGRPIPLFG